MMPTVELSVEAGPPNSVQIQVHAGGKNIALPISPNQAAILGQALLAASVLCDPRCSSVAPGSKISNGRLPAASWRVGAIDHGARPILDVRLVSGAVLSILLTPSSAIECGEQLQMMGRLSLAPESGPKN
ncbi:hypothetical protein J2X36_002528 [Methylobacterium sp. BE186]|uniref:hypothetical protein n=1 Tax=Methylobacterium sp. BE186 TaxID=2817715 RepID=UPI0028632102|nr:hypothetical protein [Methylobacterium sp. BE186]MDR7037777.1 hypothetical protein [Methylobacterium sp. BE186]